ncbi:MAG: carboxypeptidase-like regulatory domain-containing protein [Terriglobia bacterium]
MYSSRHTKLFLAAWIAANALLFVGLSSSAYAQGEKPSTETTDMNVVVKEYATGEPVSQARVTLQFSEPHSQVIPRRAKKITYNAKTDAQGRCKLSGINKGPIVLTVTADGHQAYGKELQLEKDNQVFEIRLKKPQPLI